MTVTVVVPMAVTVIVTMPVTQAEGSYAGGVVMMVTARPGLMCVAVVGMSVVAGIVRIPAVAPVVAVIIVVVTMTNCMIDDVVDNIINGEQRRARRH